MSNNDKAVKIFKEALALLNKQLQMQQFGMAMGQSVGVELLALPNYVAIEPSLPLEGTEIESASLEDAEQAVELLKKASQDFCQNFSVVYDKKAIRISHN